MDVTRILLSATALALPVLALPALAQQADHSAHQKQHAPRCAVALAPAMESMQPQPMRHGAPHCLQAAADAVKQTEAEALKTYENAEPPLWDDLGSQHFPITTKSPEAQKYFDQGLRFAVNFNHAEARRAFKKAQTLDPGCALCWLGEAIVLGPNINVPMAPEANAPAMKALRQAQSHAAGVTEKERGLIDAVSKRYVDDEKADRKPLDAAYAEEMAALSGRFPDDVELLVMAAEAAMDTQPWDYWEPGGKTPKGWTSFALYRLEKALQLDPNNAGAIHLYIHLVEASDRPERAEPYADKLAALMPGAGHIVHMPSHIYYRVGRYGDSLDSNVAASKVDEAYIAKTGAVGVYPIGYYSHNVHFVLVSAQLLGDKTIVLEQADKLDKWLTQETATAIPIAQPVKAAPYFAWAQYGDPRTVLALAEPPGMAPYVKAAWHYMRGESLAEIGDVAGARKEVEAIDKIGRGTDWAVMDAWAIPAREVLEVERHVLDARIAQAEKNSKAALAAFEKAAAAERKIPYMEPPFWYYPVEQSLGARELELGNAAAAEKHFKAALEKARGNAFAIYGLKETAKAKGDAAAEKKALDDLQKAWRGAPSMLSLEQL